MADKLRVGVIGCGEISSNHVLGYLNSERYEIIALADLSEDAMKDFDAKYSGYDDYKAKHFTDAHEMLDKSKLDVVSVGVWDMGHAPMTIAAAATPGVKAVLCEKPMSDTTGNAADMMLVCRRNNVKLAISHQRRFLPAYNLAKDMIAAGDIGAPRLITTFARDGLPNYSSHLADMYRYILGDPECVWVMGGVERETDQWARAVPIEDKALGVWGFDNGAQAMILSGLTPESSFGARIYGSDGMIELSVDDLKIMNTTSGGWQEHKPDGEFAKYGADNFEMIEAGSVQAREFARWVNGEIEDYRGVAENGYKALEMVHAVYESARTHSQVYLPLKTKSHPLTEMIDSGHLPVLYPGRYDIRNRTLRGENTTLDTKNV
ncbi:MAG: Gfo/Idh/MocA family oxidoreductase [SAR202 cluster bacterium]|nr:Gfo/Idh/MocA family oxidoreductase [SAR202 cluster bacterium]MDP6716312.1 Gfo/Idh/MocA family oxidoreductase [SAR202 cluster bacterium]